jgi:serine/threonine protein phosphatase 1
MSYTPFKHHTYNKVGRDFVVGDIHGMFYALEDLLKDLKFNPIIDRVFSVGDLIDRGPESSRILEFLDKPWFHAIMGNHEAMLIDSKHDAAMFRSWTTNNGGDWWLNVDDNEREVIRERVKQLPLAGEISTDSGTIGIVHADIPKGISWSNFVQKVHTDEDLCDYILWSRNRYRHYQVTKKTERVDGIDLVVLGHTPVKDPIHVSNICYLDTGAAYRTRKTLGKLSILEIQPKLKLYQINTRKPRRPWLG